MKVRDFSMPGKDEEKYSMEKALYNMPRPSLMKPSVKKQTFFLLLKKNHFPNVFH